MGTEPALAAALSELSRAGEPNGVVCHVLWVSTEEPNSKKLVFAGAIQVFGGS